MIQLVFMAAFHFGFALAPRSIHMPPQNNQPPIVVIGTSPRYR
jgi:hypothetical protein